MLTKYRDPLSHPGAALFSSTALWARLPMSMAGLGIVLLIHERTGSYGEAGVMSAAYVLSAAAFGPWQGRLVDRLGQSTVLFTVGTLYALGMTAFIPVLDAGWSTPWPHLCLILTGMATPQVGSMVRARWSHLLTDHEQLNTAFSIEAVLDEVAFIVGPVLVTFLTLHVSDVSGLLFAATAAFLGSLALAVQRGTAPPVSKISRTDRVAIGWSVLGPMVGVSCCLGIIFGSAEVIIAAFTEEQGNRGAAGLVLAVWAAGSLVAGIAVGALPRAANPLRRLRTSILVLGLLFAPFMLLSSIPLLAVGMFFGGFMISPSLISMVNLIERQVPPSRLTEALTWSMTGMSVGIAPGAAIVGVVIDNHGASAGFLVPLVAGLGGAAIAWSVHSVD